MMKAIRQVLDGRIYLSDKWATYERIAVILAQDQLPTN